MYVFKVGGIKEPVEEVKKPRTSARHRAAPVVLGKGLICEWRREAKFITVKGIDPELEKNVTQVDRALVAGAWMVW